MKITRVAVVLFFILFVRCAASARVPLASHSDIESAGTVTLTVLSAADNSTAIPEVKVSTIEDDGSVKTVAETDAWGRAELTADILRRSRVVIFCHPLFYCGALRKEDLTGFQKRTIAIAPLVLR